MLNSIAARYAELLKKQLSNKIDLNSMIKLMDIQELDIIRSCGKNINEIKKLMKLVK